MSVSCAPCGLSLSLGSCGVRAVVPRSVQIKNRGLPRGLGLRRGEGRRWAPSGSGWRDSGSSRTGCGRPVTGTGGGPTSASGSGARSARTTAPDGQAWDYLPHDHARSRAYRWGEDGLAGFCDIEQRLCLALALWNGRDPILKERAFGLTGEQGNHGEDVKEYWWYLDAIPSHAWNRWRYHYPQAAFPYRGPDRRERRRGTGTQPEYELLDTGVFDDDRYWIVEVHYAKAGPDDLLMAISVTNAGPDAATLHVLPTAWFRNTWSWDGSDGPCSAAARRPDRRGGGQRRPPVRAASSSCSPARAGRRAAGGAVLRERDQRGPAVRRGAGHAVPQGRHQRPRDRRGGDRQPGAAPAPSARSGTR